MRWSDAADLALAGVLLLVTDALALAGVGGAGRIVIGLATVLLVPGYALLAAIRPERRGAAGEGIERLAIGGALSVAIVPLLALAAGPIGIGELTILSLVTAFTFGALAIAFARRRALAPERRYAPRLPPRSVSGAIAVAMIAIVVGTALAASVERDSERFTEFYVVGEDGTVEGVPRVAVGNETRVLVGITNHEGRAVEYALRVVAEPAGAVLLERTISLDDDGSFEGPISITLPGPGDYRIVLQLTRAGDPQPSHQLHFDVRVPG